MAEKSPQAERAGGDSPHLDESERGQAADHTAPRALVIHEIIREEGESALKRPARGLAWSALAAGLSMGFSFLLQAVIQAGLPEAPWRHLVSSFGYCAGFIIVILGRQQLFTESTLTAVLPVLTRRDPSAFFLVPRLWIIVLLANLVGTAIFAGLLCIPGVFEQSVIAALNNLSAQATANEFWPTLLHAVFAGWLIALMVWLLPSARSARLFTILLISYAVGAARLSHIVAGSADAAYAVFMHHSSVHDFFLRFFFPTLIGNIVGGVSLVALLNHAAIAPEISEGRGSK